MKLEGEIVLKEYENVLGGYTGLLAFRLMNLCVKSDPASLLAVKVEVLGQEKNIEELSKVSVPSDATIHVYPFHEDLLPMIGKAIVAVHPEFRQSIETVHIEKANKDLHYLQLTVPEVDKTRHDILTDGVDLCYNDAKAKLDAAKQKYAVLLADKMYGETEHSADEAMARFDRIFDDNMKIAKQSVDDKQKEIEDAYQRYRARKDQQAQALAEQRAAEGHDVASTLKFPTE